MQRGRGDGRGEKICSRRRAAEMGERGFVAEEAGDMTFFLFFIFTSNRLLPTKNVRCFSAHQHNALPITRTQIERLIRISYHQIIQRRKRTRARGGGMVKGRRQRRKGGTAWEGGGEIQRMTTNKTNPATLVRNERVCVES